MLLANKIAVVYGAGGIGSAVALAFARQGARVFLASRTEARTLAVVEEIRKAGGTAEAAAVDALDETAVERHLDAVERTAGRIDVVFDAVGMQDVQGAPLVEMSLADFLRPIEVAMRSKFATARAAARSMMRRRSGVILTITAGPSRRAYPNVGGFDTACAAIEALWRTFAAELGRHGVRMVVVGSAGSPDTPDVRATIERHAAATGQPLEAVLAEFGSDTLLGRLPSAAEIAGVAAIMASDYASPMTGAIANATCGYIVD